MSEALGVSLENTWKLLHKSNTISKKVIKGEDFIYYEVVFRAHGPRNARPQARLGGSARGLLGQCTRWATGK